MSEQNLPQQQRQQLPARAAFARTVEALAQRELVNLFASDVGKQAAARVGVAFRAAASAAKDPSAFYACSPESVAAAMATSAFTSIMPGGPFPGCYLIPKKINDVQTLQWWINHRGIKTLARRAGQGVEALPYFEGDTVIIERGKDWRVEVIEGSEEHREDFTRLLGVVYFVTDLESGALLAARKVSKRQILKRKAKGQGGNVWAEWPMEMAEKTAIKFAAARGDLIFDDLGNMALAREAEAEGEDVIAAEPATPYRPPALPEPVFMPEPEPVEVAASK